MSDNVEKTISLLKPEIGRKCDEIRMLRKERLMSRLFIALCMAVVIMPTVFVFLGISILFILLPSVAVAFVFFVLSSVLINLSGGAAYEQA